MQIFLFSISAFISFQSSSKKVNQINSNVVCVVARLVFVFCCPLTMGVRNAFQNFFYKSKEIEVLRRI